MNKQELFEEIKKKQSFLCIGLDSDLTKIPSHLLKEKDPIFSFNKSIVDATANYCVAYKPNLAFYECNGVEGWISLEKTIDYIQTNYPHHLIIADAKRGDIGNTAKMYAQCFFEKMKVDAVTVAPYMGKDSVMPFLGYTNKWVILLALTSNEGAKDFQLQQNKEGTPLFEEVLTASQKWGNEEQLMYVIGATQGELFKKVRQCVPNHFLLVPGVGAQGGSLKDVCRYGMNKTCGLLVNSSRAIIYASHSFDFAESASRAAKQVQTEMAKELSHLL